MSHAAALECSDMELSDFLGDLTRSAWMLNDWEQEFVQANARWSRFSDRQRQVIAKLIERYGPKIGW